MSYLADVVEVGGNGGGPFNFNGTENGSLLKTIHVWEGDWQIKAMKVWLTDGRSEQFGKPAGNAKEFTFEDGEHFTSLSLWANKAGTRLGAIKFKTSHSRKFYASLTGSGWKPEVSVDVASGICVGIKGHSGLDIDRLGFIFINTIKSAEMTSVKYPTIPGVMPKVVSGNIKFISYHNNTSATQQYNIEASKKITETSSWSVTGKEELTYSLKVMAGIPKLVEINGKYELKIGVEDTYPSNYSADKMQYFSFTVKVPPRETVDVEINLAQATVDLPFTGIMKITCRNGGVLEYKTSGTYKGVAFSDGEVVVKESNKTLGVA